MMKTTFVKQLFILICLQLFLTMYSFAQCKVSSARLVTNDTSYSDWIYSYTSFGKVSSINQKLYVNQVYVDSLSNVVSFEHDPQNRLKKFTDGYVEGMSGAGNSFIYKYDPNTGKLTEEINACGSACRDSSVYQYQNPALVTITSYKYNEADTDTIVRRYEANAEGNLWRVYSNQARRDTMLLELEYEYYQDAIPVSFNFSFLQSVFPENRLIKKETYFSYTIQDGQLNSRVEYSQYSYIYDQDNKIIQMSINSSEDNYYSTFSFNYLCE